MTQGPKPSRVVSIDPVEILAERFAAAIRAAVPGLTGEPEPMITPGRQAQLGDFQCNAAMGLAKALGRPPREIAQAIAAAVDLSGVAEPLTAQSIAGPGFINIRLDAGALAGLLAGLEGPGGLGPGGLGLGVPKPERPETVVVDLCGVNLAKQMHVGHIRSTVIGDAIARVFERLGHRVIRQNHVGDWGLQIGMVVWKLAELGSGELGSGELGSSGGPDLAAIEALYRSAQAQTTADRRGLDAARRWGHPKALAELEAQVQGADEAMARAKAWLVRLQGGDPEALRLWGYVREVTMAACMDNCRALWTAIGEADEAGESSYRDELAGLVDDLVARGVAEASEGMLIVRVEGLDEPCLIRKSDGGYLYATTDLAAVRRRVRVFGADRVIYCVDARQALHFKQVFGAAIRAGYAERDGPAARLEHAAFGTILGEDGKPFKTRSGDTVVLSDLLTEAVERATAIVREKNPGLEGLESVASRVAIAAIKYADLSTERIKDYVFSLDRMLAFEGNTGPYLLYALVRLRSIQRRAAEAGIDAAAEAMGAGFVVAEPQEKALALALLGYPRALESVAQTLEPHRLCGYLYDLATAFSAFFDRCPVLKESPAVRGPRLKLCALTARVLADGLAALGLPEVERM